MKQKRIGKYWSVSLFDNNKLEACYLGNACAEHKHFNNIDESIKKYNSIKSQSDIFKTFPDARERQKGFDNWLRVKK